MGHGVAVTHRNWFLTAVGNVMYGAWNLGVGSFSHNRQHDELKKNMAKWCSKNGCESPPVDTLHGTKDQLDEIVGIYFASAKSLVVAGHLSEIKKMSVDTVAQMITKQNYEGIQEVTMVVCELGNQDQFCGNLAKKLQLSLTCYHESVAFGAQGPHGDPETNKKNWKNPQYSIFDKNGKQNSPLSAPSL